ncbi:basic proline-rich protein-like [Passer montanus]|uniref:basic proline-rich protein-like n=1 Tax=Passer montanus TaxID=9160 RepID=UPI001961603F|nr:basic proline-rich protein-like [Passer montanus]
MAAGTGAPGAVAPLQPAGGGRAGRGHGSAPLRSPGSSVISGSSQEAIRLPWREVSPRDPSLQLAPANATPGPVRPWGRRPPGIPLPRAAPRGSSPPPLAFPPRGSALGEMPALGPAPRPPSPHPSSPGFGPPGPVAAAGPGGGRRTDGRAAPAGQAARLGRASRAEPLGHTGELSANITCPASPFILLYGEAQILLALRIHTDRLSCFPGSS